MYMQTQLTDRIAHLKSISPSGALSLFSGLETAISEYFIRDVEFESLIRKTLMRVASDALSRGIEVEYPERLPPMSTDFPPGYNNITELFGDEVFNEIMTIADATFVAAFVSETGGGNNGATVILKNAIITRWTGEISASRGTEVAALETLGEFCTTCNEDRGLALIFEELGQIKQYWSDDRIRQFGRHCYIDRGFDEIIKAFNLNVFEPHYISELR